MTTTTVHVFEQAGLGRAPFKFVGIERRSYQAAPGAPIQPGAGCQYCGTGIVECCVIRDADGKEFVVGNVCVGKTADRGLIDTVKRAVNRARTEARRERENARIGAARDQLEKNTALREAFASQPHPLEWRREQGDTLLDWAMWMLRNAGNRGALQVVKAINQFDGTDVR